MISVKNKDQLKLMRDAGRITGEALALAGESIKPGMTTKQLDTIIRHHIERSGAKPSFLGYGGFPASACISVNNTVIHGIPGNTVIREGDIVSVDVGATYKGFVGDCAGTFPCGHCSDEAIKLIAKNLRKAVENDPDGREGMALGQYMTGMAFSNVGLGVVHGMAHPLSAFYNTPHGVANALLIEEVIRCMENS